MSNQAFYKAIPVTERMPKIANENYLTISEKGIETARFFNGKRFESAHYEGIITHWLEKLSTPITPTDIEKMAEKAYMQSELPVEGVFNAKILRKGYIKGMNDLINILNK
jgi:hypothetical protein